VIQSGNPNLILTDDQMASHMSAAIKFADSKFAKPKHQRVPENPSPRSGNTAKSKVPPLVAEQIKSWSASSDPVRREAAERMKLKHGIK
jgi:hypothetical protein